MCAMTNIGQAFSDSLRGVERPAEVFPDDPWPRHLRRSGAIVVGLSSVGIALDLVSGRPALVHLAITLITIAVAAALVAFGWLWRALRGERGLISALGAAALAAAALAAVALGQAEQLVPAAIAIAAGITAFTFAQVVRRGAGIVRVFALLPLASAGTIAIAIIERWRLGSTFDLLWVVAFCGLALVGFALGFAADGARS